MRFLRVAVFLTVAVLVCFRARALEDCFGNETTPLTEQEFKDIIADWSRELFVEPDEDRRFASCIAYSSDHYRTFDGLFYTFGGSCTYTLMSTSGIAVEIDNSGCNEETCERVTYITLSGGTYFQYSIRANSTHAYIETPSFLNILGESTSLDFAINASASLPGIGSDPNRHSMVVAGANVYFRFGDARVKLGPNGYVVVTLETEDYFNDANLVGLCGSFDGDRENDFRDNEGQFVAHAAAFGNSWKITDYNPLTTCPDATESVHPCMRVTDYEKGAAVASCLYMQKGTFEPYKDEFGVEMYKLGCVYDYCKAITEGLKSCVAICDSFMVFAELSNAKADGPLVEWRTEEFCPKQCVYPHMEYLECGPSCCHTCKFAGRSLDDSCFEECTPGCFCQEGYYMDSEMNCILKEECPCVHNEHEYALGDVIAIDECNNCTCDGGTWSCTDYQCDGVCYLTGHGHYRTFDGVRYLFPENCEYVFAETMDAAAVANKDFHIKIKSINCVGNHQACEKQLIVKIKGEKHGQQTIVLTPDTITVDGNTFTATSKTVDGVTVAKITTNYVGIFKDGFMLHFNTFDSRIMLKLSPVLYEGDVHGLCGFYDNNPANDFKTRTNVVEADVLSFAHGWTTSGSTCTFMTAINGDMCATYSATRRIKAELYCENLLSAEAFEQCRKILSPEPYYKQCLYDICSTSLPNVVSSCSAMAAYAHECHRYLKLDEVDALDGWVAEVISDEMQPCSPSCPGGTAYTECAPGCGMTCQEASVGSLERQTCDNRCMSGCACDRGLLYDEVSESCIASKQCPCQFPGRTDSYSEGQMLVEGCMNCTCSSGTWKCEVEDMCDHSCPANMVFKKNAQPCLPTCDSYFAEEPEECPFGTIAGLCTCPPGLVLKDVMSSKCIDPSQCPCQHAGRWYDAGEQINQDCNTCMCNGRNWACTQQACHATCSATGSVHYSTFDGLDFTFHGDCSYIMVEDNEGRFKVETSNVACGSNNLACTKEVKIYVNTTVITLLKGNGIEVNTRKIGKDQFGGLYEPSKGIRIDEPGAFTVVKIDRADGTNFSVAWDGEMSVYIRVSPELAGAISGLCGNYNGDLNDDLRSSANVLETNSDNFANSWKTDGNCPDRIDGGLNPRDSIRATWAEKQCAKVRDKKIFGECHDKVNPESYYEDCITDAVFCDRGGDCECLCTAVARYARMCCNDHNICPSWRDEDYCPYSCGTCHDEDIWIHFDNVTYPLEHTCRQYRVCGPACPLTCQNYAAQSAEDCGDDRCYEGCFCKAGYIWDPYTETCVLPDGCPCAYKKPGSDEIQLVGKGFTFYSDICSKCVCTEMGEIECSNDDNNPDCGCDKTFEIPCIQTRSGKNHTICVSNLYVCDGNIDCEYGEDEENCNPDCEYRCDDRDVDGQCYTEDDICDGECDCLQKGPNYCLDEIDCEPSCNTTTHFVCPSTHICIPEGWVCDGEIDCVITPEEASGLVGIVITYLPGDGTSWNDEMNCYCENSTNFQCINNPRHCLNDTMASITFETTPRAVENCKLIPLGNKGATH